VRWCCFNVVTPGLTCLTRNRLLRVRTHLCFARARCCYCCHRSTWARRIRWARGPSCRRHSRAELRSRGLRCCMRVLEWCRFFWGDCWVVVDVASDSTSNSAAGWYVIVIVLFPPAPAEAPQIRVRTHVRLWLEDSGWGLNIPEHAKSGIEQRPPSKPRGDAATDGCWTKYSGYCEQAPWRPQRHGPYTTAYGRFNRRRKARV